MSEADPLQPLLSRQVVLDVAAPFVFLGTLAEFSERTLVLTDADVHDLRDSSTTREVYVLDARRHGISANRSRVYVNRNEVVAASALEDVTG